MPRKRKTARKGGMIGCFGNRCSRRNEEKPPTATLREAVNEFGTNQLKEITKRNKDDVSNIDKRMETNAALAAFGMFPPGEPVYKTHYNNYHLGPGGVVTPYPTNVAKYTQGPKGSITSGQGRRTRRRKHSRRRR